MRATLLGLALLTIAGVIKGQTESYKITKVIEIGPAATVQGMSGSVKWSPDGTMLAYFANNFLMVSDTLGSSRQVAAIAEQYPFRAEWASDTEFAVNLKGEQRSDSTLYRLVVYDIESGESRLVDQYWRHRWSLMPGERYFSGPFVTLEGTAYYVRGLVTRDEKAAQGTMVAPIEFDRQWLPISPTKAVTLELDHLFRRGQDGLYLIAWSGIDSTRLCESGGGSGTVVSRTGAHVFADGILYNRGSGDTIDVRDYAGPPPPNTGGCMFLRPMFNPVGPELLFQYVCEGEDPYVVDRVGTFNYATKEFTLLDTLTAFGSWQLPEYAPDGRMIAMTSGYKAYIIWREVEK